jgi:hypothetical protein
MAPRATKASAANVEATTAPIVIAGVARSRWAPAPRPTVEDWAGGRFYRSINQAPPAARWAGKGATYWWVPAEPGEAATQGAVLAVESADGTATIIPVPVAWSNRWAANARRVEAAAPIAA